MGLKCLQLILQCSLGSVAYSKTQCVALYLTQHSEKLEHSFPSDIEAMRYCDDSLKESGLFPCQEKLQKLMTLIGKIE